jgi:hypothetical protein
MGGENYVKLISEKNKNKNIVKKLLIFIKIIFTVSDF